MLRALFHNLEVGYGIVVFSQHIQESLHKLEAAAPGGIDDIKLEALCLAVFRHFVAAVELDGQLVESFMQFFVFQQELQGFCHLFLGLPLARHKSLPAPGRYCGNEEVAFLGGGKLPVEVEGELVIAFYQFCQYRVANSWGTIVRLSDLASAVFLRLYAGERAEEQHSA